MTEVQEKSVDSLPNFRELSFDQIWGKVFDDHQLHLIKDVPTFNELVEVYNEIEDLSGTFRGLTEGHDVPQRALELMEHAEQVREKVLKLILQFD